MGQSLNRATLIGRVGKDAETQFLPSGHQVTKFSVATSREWKDKQGAKQEETTWHNVVVWGKVAEVAAQYVKKGMLVFLEGRISVRDYQGKDGGQRRAFEIVAEQMKFLSRNDGARAGAANGGQFAGAQSAKQAADGFESEHEWGAGAQESAGRTEISDDDIPF